MRWPLLFFALLLVLLQLVKAIRGEKGQSWGYAADAARHVFIPFAAAAVLMIVYGWPPVPAICAAWAVLVLQGMHVLATLFNKAGVARCVHWASLIVVGAMWVMLLPVFDKVRP